MTTLTWRMTPKETKVCKWPRLRANVRLMPRVTVVATVVTAAATVATDAEVATDADVATEVDVVVATEAGAVVPALRTIVAVSKGAVASCRPT